MSNPGNSLGYGKHCRFGTCQIRETLWDTGNTVGLEHVQSGKLSGIRETLSVWNMSNPGNSLGYGKHCRFGTCPIREALWDTGNTVGLEHVQSGKLSGIRETLSVWNMSNPGSSLGYWKHCRFGTCPIREALWDTGNTVGTCPMCALPLYPAYIMLRGQHAEPTSTQSHMYMSMLGAGGQLGARDTTGAYCALCGRCAKSWPFSTTASSVS